MQISGVGQIGIYVKDLDRMVAFYRDVLNLPLLGQFGELAFFDCNGVRLMLGKEEEPGKGTSSTILYFRVEDLDKSHRELTGKDVRVEQEPHLVAKEMNHETWLAFYHDPEGNIFALINEKPLVS